VTNHLLVLGGGGLGRGLAHLFIWRLLWRGGLAIWRVPVIGPAIDIIIALILVGLLVARSALGPGWWQRRGGRPGGGSAGAGNGPGPRDW
jgi:hypothetical protein